MNHPANDPINHPVVNRILHFSKDLSIVFLVMNMIHRMVETEVIVLSPESEIVLTFIKEIVSMIMYSIIAFEPLMYLAVDKELQDVVAKVLRLK